MWRKVNGKTSEAPPRWSECQHVYMNVYACTCSLCVVFIRHRVQGHVASVLLVHLTFLPDSCPCRSQQGVRTSHICEVASIMWGRWQWGRWANAMCCYRNKSFRTSAAVHIWTHEMHFNEKLKVSLAHFGPSAAPRGTAGHDVTSMPSCPEVSTQASVPSGSVGLKGFLASGH